MRLDFLLCMPYFCILFLKESPLHILSSLGFMKTASAPGFRVLVMGEMGANRAHVGRQEDAEGCSGDVLICESPGSFRGLRFSFMFHNFLYDLCT